MAKDLSKRKTVYFTDDLKAEVEQIAEETGLSANHLIVLATYSLVANYRAKGTFIFADLLNPEHRSKKREV